MEHCISHILTCHFKCTNYTSICVHKLYFPGNGSNYLCLPENDFNGALYSLYLFSFLKRERLSLGTFFTLLPNEDNIPTLSLAFSPKTKTGTSLVGRLHSVSVSLLGAQFITEVNIHNGNMACNADVDIFGKVSTTLKIQAPTSSPWKRLDHLETSSIPTRGKTPLRQWARGSHSLTTPNRCALYYRVNTCVCINGWSKKKVGRVGCL